jgi:protocatechuate 3,4-dioxygenase alpha subunit
VSGTTPSQTVGPFFAIGLLWEDGAMVVPKGTAGAIRIGGYVLDSNGDPVPDALVETWQADPDGVFGTGFRGFGRKATDGDGAWHVLTLKPGRVQGQAPHIDVSVFARGLLNRVVTRIYFGDCDNAADPVLATVDPARRGTLIAQPQEGGYRFDIVLQGQDETVFFRV